MPRYLPWKRSVTASPPRPPPNGSSPVSPSALRTSVSCWRWRLDAEHVPHALDEVAGPTARSRAPCTSTVRRARSSSPALRGVDLDGEPRRRTPSGGPARCAAAERLDLARRRRPARAARVAWPPSERAPCASSSPAASPACGGVRQRRDARRLHALAGDELGLDLRRCGASPPKPSEQLALRVGERVERVEVADDAAAVGLQVDGVAPLRGQRAQERPVASPRWITTWTSGSGPAGVGSTSAREAVGAEDRLGDPAVRGAGPGDDLLLGVELERAVERLHRQPRAPVGVELPARPRSTGRRSGSVASPRVDLDRQRRARRRSAGRAGSSTRRRRRARRAATSVARVGLVGRLLDLHARAARSRSSSATRLAVDLDAVSARVRHRAGRSIWPGCSSRVASRHGLASASSHQRVESPAATWAEQVEPVAGADRRSVPRSGGAGTTRGAPSTRAEPSGATTVDHRQPGVAGGRVERPSAQLQQSAAAEHGLDLARALVVGRRPRGRTCRPSPRSVGAQHGEAEVGASRGSGSAARRTPSRGSSATSSRTGVMRAGPQTKSTSGSLPAGIVAPPPSRRRSARRRGRRAATSRPAASASRSPRAAARCRAPWSAGRRARARRWRRARA